MRTLDEARKNLYQGKMSFGDFFRLKQSLEGTWDGAYEMGLARREGATMRVILGAEQREQLPIARPLGEEH